MTRKAWVACIALLVLATQVAQAGRVGLPWVQARAVPIHASPDWDAGRKGWLEPGTSADTTGATTGAWTPVKTASGTTGYVNLDWVLPEEASLAPLTITSHATDPAVRRAPFLRFDRIGASAGLPETTVSAICQDAQGFLWVGTEGGLARYDGYAFKSFLHHPNEEDSLADPFVRRLLTDPNGQVWIGTGKGLQLLDPASGKFLKTYRHDDKDEKSLVWDVVETLFIDSRGRLWIGTEEGLCRLDRETQSFTRYHLEAHSGHHHVHAIAEAAPDRMWIVASGADGGSSLTEIDVISGKQREFSSETAEEAAKGPPEATALDSNRADADGFVWTTAIQKSLCRSSMVHRDREGGLWFGTLIDHDGKISTAVVHRDPVKKAYTSYDLTDDIKDESLRTSLPTALMQDRWGDVWVGLPNAGLVCIDSRTGWHGAFMAARSDAETISGNWLRSLFEDRGGVLWVGVQASGLCKASALRFQENFRHFKQEADKSNSMLTSRTCSLFVDKDGMLWVGCEGEGGGLSAFSNGGREVRQFKYKSNDGKDGPASNLIWRLVQDPDGSIWVTSMDGRFQKFDPKAGNGPTFQVQGDWAGPYTDAMYDGEDGIWATAYGIGLVKFGRASSSFELAFTAGGPTALGNHPLPPALTTGGGKLSTNLVQCVRQDKKSPSVLWVGTEKGLDRVDVRTGTVGHFGEKDGLGYDTVFTIYEDADAVLWIGTGGGGMTRWDRTAKQVKTFTVREGLPSNTIYGILQDNVGHIWISTTRGICSFDPRSEKVLRTFDMSDGLQDLSFAHSLSVKNPKNGEFYMGGRNNGFNAFYPDSIREYHFAPPVVISRFLHGLHDAKISDLLDPTGVIKLAYDDAVSFQLAALSYEASLQNQLRYKIEGFRDEWMPVGGDRMITLQNLPPGQFTMTVEGADHHGTWNTADIHVGVTFRPPWWRTNLAYATYLVLLMLAPLWGFRIHRARMDRLRDTNRLSEIERSLEITGAIQEGFLPRANHYKADRVEVLGYYQPADKASGDWWWYQDLPDESYCVMVADVTGHGPGPAILTAAMATAFRVQDLMSSSLEERLRHVNAEVRRVSTSHFITVTAVELHKPTGKLRVVSLGGVPAMLVDPSGKATNMGKPGTPLGSPEYTAGISEGTLVQGARIILYSDGLPEMKLPSGDDLGKKRTKTILSASKDKPLPESMEQIRRDIEEARSGIPLNDDITVVLVSRASS